VALLYAPTDDQKGARIIRAREGVLETGEVRPVSEGRALNGQELVRLRPHDKFPALCDVETLHPAEKTDRTTNGPAQVATEDYRRNWEQTFGPKPPKSGLVN
jgi:hypothetical protein